MTGESAWFPVKNVMCRWKFWQLSNVWLPILTNLLWGGVVLLRSVEQQVDTRARIVSDHDRYFITVKNATAGSDTEATVIAHQVLSSSSSSS